MVPVRKGPLGLYMLMMTPDARAFVLTSSNERGGVPSAKKRFPAIAWCAVPCTASVIAIAATFFFSIVFLLRMGLWGAGRPPACGVLSPSLLTYLICSFKSAAQLLVGCRIEKDLSHLDLPPSGGDAFARPCHRLVHVSAFQYPKTADVFLGLKVRPVGDEDSAIGLRSQRLRGPKAASESPDAGSDHLFIERVDLATRRFVRLRRV